MLDENDKKSKAKARLHITYWCLHADYNRCIHLLATWYTNRIGLVMVVVYNRLWCDWRLASKSKTQRKYGEKAREKIAR